MSAEDTTESDEIRSIPDDNELSDTTWSYTDDDDDDSIRIDDSDSDDDKSDWEAEWEENLRELKYLFTGIAIPFVGRWFGRRFAFWIWTNYWEAWLGVGRRWLLAATSASV
ncbi:hypothetical protein BDF22DRAFT_743356 [Syncephalis plumigaleata]|nr:hypothetical protein BDF22DRAFT_743356 [Syncephalis plumigaleata]